MHTYKIYDKNFTDGFKQEWFSPKSIENFYDKDQKSLIFESEGKFLEAFKLFAGTDSFTVCELEKYREYYGVNYMKKAYPKEYPGELLAVYESIEENDVYSGSDAENIFRLMFRGHIWCRLKSADTEIFFEKLGNLTVLTAKTPSGTVENIRNLEISEKDF